jgi:hypothetical protein
VIENGGTIRRLVLSEGVWEPVTTNGYVPGQVLAASYSYFEKKLWILDEVNFAGHWGAKRRIVRLDPETGAAETLAVFPRLGLFEDYWFRVDRDGSLLLFASSPKAKKHVIARLGVAQGKLQIFGVRLGQGALVAPPTVDMEGYWLVTQSSPKFAAEPKRLQDLGLVSVPHPKPADWM